MFWYRRQPQYNHRITERDHICAQSALEPGELGRLANTGRRVALERAVSERVALERVQILLNGSCWTTLSRCCPWTGLHG